MKRLLKLWLALLAALWLTRAAVSALLFEAADRSVAGIVQVIAVSALQALAIGWLTRDRKPPPG
jgi:hypothetical protein